MVLISHDLDVIRYLCDRTVVMRAGEVVEEAPTGQLFAAPHHDYTRMLIAALPRLDAGCDRAGGIALASTAPPAAALSISGVSVSFSSEGHATHAVRGVSLSVHAGQILAIVGESGSGKSVLLRSLLGLLPATATVSGRVAIRGQTADA